MGNMCEGNITNDNSRHDSPNECLISGATVSKLTALVGGLDGTYKTYGVPPQYFIDDNLISQEL